MKIVARDNGLFVLRGSSKNTIVKSDFDPNVLECASKENGNFIAKLFYADYLMNNSRIEDACQVRLDASVELLQTIDDEDEIEFDLSDSNTFSAIKLLSLSALDHFFICDFDMTVSLAETVLDLNPEDNEGMINLLGYSYAMLGDREAVNDVMPFLQMSLLEKELIVALVSFKEGKRTNLSEKLVKSLIDKESDLAKKTSHLWLEVPDFLNFVNCFRYE